jgi:diketogulonate reductase-like aldo/keto reductase
VHVPLPLHVSVPDSDAAKPVRALRNAKPAAYSASPMTTRADVKNASLSLNTGARIPQVGLGVWQSARGRVTRDAVREALRVGYRHVDTARIYGNEADVGAAIRDGEVPRDQVFVTTKLWNDDQGYDAALRAFDTSLTRLGLEYVDLYLIHWPVPGKRLDSWRALEKIFDEKRARAVGVSNYMPNHLEELLARARIVPAANQIEVSPFLQRRETRAFCEKKGIIVCAYSPLTRGERLRDPRVVAVAKQAKRTPAQVLLRWGVQHGLVVLPKSTRPERIAENAAIFDFELPAEAMRVLDGLEEGLATGWDPTTQR